MKKNNSEDIRTEYKREDLGPGTRGKHYKEYKAGANLALISPDIAEVFPTDEAVNNALRSLIELAKKSVSPTAHPG